MKFTIVFHTHESFDRSYGLVFVPSPVWIQGHREVLNLNPENPEYRLGSTRKLIQQEDILDHLAANTKECAIIIHQTGHGTAADLQMLQDDLQQEGFMVTTHPFFERPAS